MNDDKQESSLHVLRNRNFLFLWMAQALSQTAQNAVFFALLVYVEVTTGSTFHMSVLILSSILPSVIFGVAAGVLVDRVQKKTVLVVTNLLRGAVIVIFLILSLDITPVHIRSDSGDISILAFAAIYLLNFVFSTISQFFGPAEAASIPLLVKRNQLITANGLFNLTFTGSQLAGFVLIAPPLIKWFGVPVLFVTIIVIYAICTVLASTLPANEPQHKPLSDLTGSTLLTSLRTELRDGWALLTGDRLISLAMIHLTLVATLMLVLGMLAPGFVARILGIRADDAVYIFAPAGLGVIIGTILLPHLTYRYGKAILSAIGLVVMSLSLAVLAIAPGGGRFLVTNVVPRVINPNDIPSAISLVSAVASMSLLMGLAFSFINIPAQTIIQERAPVFMRGRIFAIQLTFGNLASVLPLIFLGALADVIGILTVLLVMSLSVLAVGLYSYHQIKKIVPADALGDPAPRSDTA